MLKKYFEPGALFSYHAFRNLWISTIFTVIAISAFPIALAIEILDSGGSATTLGLILGIRVLTGVVFSPVGGVWADRLPRKTILIVSDGFRGVLGTTVIFFNPDSMSIWILAIIVGFMGISDGFGAPASQAIIPSILPEHLWPSGNVVRNLAIKGSTVAGPGIAGVIVGTVGTHATFIACSIFFLLGAALLFRIDEGKKLDDAPAGNKFFYDLKEGFKVVWEVKWIAAMIIMASIQLLLVVATETVMLPVITRREFDTSSVFAVSAALFSLGGAISAIICLKLKIKNRGTVAVVMWGLFIFAPLVLAFPSSKEIVFIAYFIAGLSIGPWEAFWSLAVQQEVEPEMQARVFSIDYMGTVGLLPLGLALAGPAAEFFGEKDFLIGVSVFHLLICAVTLLVPGVREMRSPGKSDYSQSEQKK